MNPIIVYGGLAAVIILLAVAVALLSRKRKEARQIQSAEAERGMAAFLARRRG